MKLDHKDLTTLTAITYISDVMKRYRMVRAYQGGDVNERLWWLAIAVVEIDQARMALASIKPLSSGRLAVRAYAWAARSRIRWDTFWLALDVKHLNRCKRTIACALCNEIRAREHNLQETRSGT